MLWYLRCRAERYQVGGVARRYQFAPQPSVGCYFTRRPCEAPFGDAETAQPLRLWHPLIEPPDLVGDEFLYCRHINQCIGAGDRQPRGLCPGGDSLRVKEQQRHPCAVARPRYHRIADEKAAT